MAGLPDSNFARPLNIMQGLRNELLFHKSNLLFRYKTTLF